MTFHQLKTWPQYFQEVKSGRKRFEFRKDDRDFQVGDWVELLEFDPETGKFSGDFVMLEIRYILRGFPGIEPGYAILGL